MSIEEAVRRKHAFEHELKDYLQFISVMSREEIELSLGRLADLLNSSHNEAEALHVSVKGAVLKIYLDLRNAGIKKQSKVKRMTLRPAMKRFFAERGRAEHARAMQQYRAACEHHKAKIIQWKEGVRSLPFLKRLLAKPSPPAAPTVPVPVEQFVMKSKAEADMSEYLIDTAVQFQLLSIPQRIEGVQREDVKKLAP